MSELERRLLGRLTQLDEIAAVWDVGLRSEAFVEPVCAAIYNFIIEYWQLERMKMAPTLLAINAAFPGIELPVDQEISATWAAEHLQTLYAANDVNEMMYEAAKVSLTDPAGAAKLLRDRSFHLCESVAPRHSRSNMATNIEDRRRRYLARQEGTGRGATLGLGPLDDYVNGLSPGELCVVGAYSKTGKTMFLANAAIAARKAGLLPVFFTLEMSKEEIEDRLDAMYCTLSYDRLIHSKLTVEELALFHQAQDDLAALGDLPVEQPDESDRTVAAMVNRARHLGADYVIIDQLSEMNPGRRVHDLKEHHAVIVKQLKNEISNGAAGRLPCLLAVQLNRDSQIRKEGIGLDSFANATEIEAKCDLALGLSRNQEMRQNKMMRLDILGSRRSGTASWRLYWDLVAKTDIRVLDRITTP